MSSTQPPHPPSSPRQSTTRGESRGTGPEPATTSEAGDLAHLPNEAAREPAMAPVITNTGDDDDGAPTG